MTTTNTTQPTNLTDRGIMMQEGLVLATDVSVDYIETDNSVKISYTDIDGVHQYHTKVIDGHNLTVLSEDSDGSFRSILAKEDGWYLFW